MELFLKVLVMISFWFQYHKIFVYPSELVFYYPIIGGLRYWCSSCIFRWQISLWNCCSIFGHHGEGITTNTFFTIHKCLEHDDINLTISVCVCVCIYCQSRFYLGDVGNGAAMKLVVNMIMGRFGPNFTINLFYQFLINILDLDNCSPFNFSILEAWWQLFPKDCFLAKK